MSIWGVAWREGWESTAVCLWTLLKNQCPLNNWSGGCVELPSSFLVFWSPASRLRAAGDDLLFHFPHLDFVKGPLGEL